MQSPTAASDRTISETRDYVKHTKRQGVRMVVGLRSKSISTGMSGFVGLSGIEKHPDVNLIIKNPIIINNEL